MDWSSPHIHVDVSGVQREAVVRNMLASTFGLAGDLPAVVTTGCGLRAPYAMTSPRPESVTCLACREHARRVHLRLAEDLERLDRMPGMTGGVRARVDRHRELAERFGG